MDREQDNSKEGEELSKKEKGLMDIDNSGVIAGEGCIKGPNGSG